jgi:hypothetical protein
MNNTVKDFARKIIRELENISKILQDSQSASISKQPTQSAGSTAHTNSKEQVVPPPVIAKPDLVASPATDPKSNGHNKERRERWKFWIEIVGAVFLIGTAIFTGLQWRAASEANKLTHEALRNARDNFRQDQRPYIWVTNDMGSPIFVPWNNDPASPTGQVIWTYRFTNYGKTPASNSTFTQEMKIGNRPFTKTYTHDKQTRESIGAPLPPNKIDFSTVVSDPGITRTEFNQVISTQSRESISIRIVFTYTDNSIGKYETGVCLVRLNTGAISYCREGNYIK